MVGWIVERGKSVIIGIASASTAWKHFIARGGQVFRLQNEEGNEDFRNY